MAYALIKEGKLVKVVKTLPTNYGNISGFDKADVKTLSDNGWLPITRNIPTSLNLDQRLGDEIVTIGKEEVVITKEVVTMDLDECKAWLIERGEQAARRALLEAYDIQTQILALSGILGNNFKDVVTQKMTDTVGVFQTFKSEVNAATTKAELLTVYNKYPALK